MTRFGRAFRCFAVTQSFCLSPIRSFFRRTSDQGIEWGPKSSCGQNPIPCGAAVAAVGSVRFVFLSTDPSVGKTSLTRLLFTSSPLHFSCQRGIMLPLHINMEDVSSWSVFSTEIELASSAVDHPEVSSPFYCTSHIKDGGDNLD